MKKILIMAALMGATFMVNAENKTAVFTVNPQMHCHNCVNRIQSNMRFEKGVVEVTPSLDDQTVTIVYKSDKTNTDKLIAGFKKIGYEADTVGAAKTEVPACQERCCEKK